MRLSVPEEVACIGIGASAKQRPVIPQDHARGVVAGGAGDATAGMRAGAAMVEALQGLSLIHI